MRNGRGRSRNPPCRIWASGSTFREEPFVAKSLGHGPPALSLLITRPYSFPFACSGFSRLSSQFRRTQQNDLMYYEKYTEPISDRSERSVRPTQEGRIGCRVAGVATNRAHTMPHVDRACGHNYEQTPSVKMKILPSIIDSGTVSRPFEFRIPPKRYISKSTRT